MRPETSIHIFSGPWTDGCELETWWGGSIRPVAGDRITVTGQAYRVEEVELVPTSGSRFDGPVTRLRVMCSCRKIEPAG